MGGGRRRRPHNNSGNNKPKNPRRGSASSSVKEALFVEGGFLSDWHLDSPSPSHNPGKNTGSNKKSGSKSGNLHGPEASGSKITCGKSSGTAIGYHYPSVDIQGVSCAGDNSEYCNLNQLQQVVLVDSKQNKIIAHVDQTPPSKPNNVEYTYSYGADFVLGDSSHTGLGFLDEHENTPSDIGVSSEHITEPQSTSVLDSSSFEKDIDADEGVDCELSNQMTENLPLKVSSKGNSGFLSIGSLKLYTKDISDNESGEDDNEESEDEERSSSSELEELAGSESNNSEGISDTDSDIDEEVAEDYLEGVGGSDNIMDAKWLLNPVLDEPDDDSSSSSGYDEALKKMGGIALQEASREYGMKKAQPWKKCYVEDEQMLVKDPRNIFARKKHVARFPHSWPLQAQKSKASKKFHGTINLHPSLHKHHQ